MFGVLPQHGLSSLVSSNLLYGSQRHVVVEGGLGDPLEVVRSVFSVEGETRELQVVLVVGHLEAVVEKGLSQLQVELVSGALVPEGCELE